MRLHLPAILFAISFLIPQSALGQTADKPEKISPKTLTERVRGQRGDDATVFYGGTMIATGDTLDGPVIVIDGPLDVQERAVLDGDAWVVNGSLVITGNGVVTGRVTFVNSSSFVSHQADIRSESVYYTCECRLDAGAYEKSGEIKFVKVEDPMALNIKPAVAVARPTRVRYDVIQLGVKRENKNRRDPYVRLSAMVNVPLYKTTQHGFLGFDVDALVPLAGHTLGLELAAYKTLYSEDFWQVSRAENAFLLVLSANEYANYYEKRGGSIGLKWLPGSSVTVSVTGMIQREVSMRTQDKVFTILGPKGNLAPNLPIDQGDRLAGRVTVQFDSRYDRVYPRNAWLLGLAIESGRLSPDADGAADVNYTGFTIEANRYTRFPFGLQWDIGARLSSSFDAIPFQLYQTLNGYGGLRGTNRVPFDVPRGDRMVRLSTEFRYALPELPVVRWIYSRWDILGFAEAGLLTEAENPTSPLGWLDTSFDHWRKTVGLGVTGESFFPYLGLYVAQEIGGDRTSPRFIIRLARSF